MTKEGVQILGKQEIEQKIKRIAYQIYENHLGKEELIIAGIQENGFILAKKIKNYLDRITPIQVDLCEVEIDKKNPLDSVSTSLSSEKLQNQSIVLVDDVLNSGTTLIYGVKHFLEVELRELHTAVLIDRSHKRFPVKADFKGLSLSTSLSEHVEVVFEKDNQYATLS